MWNPSVGKKATRRQPIIKNRVLIVSVPKFNYSPFLSIQVFDLSMPSLPPLQMLEKQAILGRSDSAWWFTAGCLALVASDASELIFTVCRLRLITGPDWSPVRSSLGIVRHRLPMLMVILPLDSLESLESSGLLCAFPSDAIGCLYCIGRQSWPPFLSLLSK